MYVPVCNKIFLPDTNLSNFWDRLNNFDLDSTIKFCTDNSYQNGKGNHEHECKKIFFSFLYCVKFFRDFKVLEKLILHV